MRTSHQPYAYQADTAIAIHLEAGHRPLQRPRAHAQLCAYSGRSCQALTKRAGFIPTEPIVATCNAPLTDIYATIHSEQKPTP